MQQRRRPAALGSMVAAALSALAAGCATIGTLQADLVQREMDLNPGLPQTLARPYSGTVADANCVAHWQVAVFCFFDLPLSLVLDTVVLPYTIYQQAEHGSIKGREARSQEQRDQESSRAAKSDR